MSTDDRTPLREQFLIDHGWGAADVEALPADASFRRYFRLTDGDRRALLMDSPPDKEDIRPYAKIDKHLIGLGLSAPRIEALDERGGFAVIEDFGNDTFNRLIANGVDEQPLYALAVDTLATLHKHPDAANVQIPACDLELLMREVVEFTDWYYPARFGAPIEDNARAQFVTAWETVIGNLPDAPQTLVLRDFHVDNLMRLGNRDGVTACGILDFQDAVLGHAAYDLVSLLEDARRDISDHMAVTMRARYQDQMPHLSNTDFDAWYAVLGAQRHTKVAGRFARILLRDGNPSYLKHIPRVMRLLVRQLNDPALAPVKDWFDAHLPDPLGPLPDSLTDAL